VPQLRYTRRARRDLIDIWLELNEVNPTAAAELYDRLEARVEILRRFPAAGPVRPDIAPEARILVEPPYLILYRLILEGVQMVRILHGARNIDSAIFMQGRE
jgi:toxin ParE1/3/4